MKLLPTLPVCPVGDLFYTLFGYRRYERPDDVFFAELQVSGLPAGLRKWGRGIQRTAVSGDLPAAVVQSLSGGITQTIGSAL